MTTKLNEDLGQRVISIIESNLQAKKLIRGLKRSLDLYLNDEDRKRYALQSAYAGFVYASLLDYNPLERLERYVSSLTDKIKRNPYISPEMIAEFFKEAFE